MSSLACRRGESAISQDNLKCIGHFEKQLNLLRVTTKTPRLASSFRVDVVVHLSAQPPRPLRLGGYAG